MRTESSVVGILIAALFFSFGVSRAAGPSQDAWDHVLKKNARQGRVDYKGLKADSRELQGYLDAIGALKESEYEAWPRADKIAFWINAYNAFTLKAIIDHYPIRSSFPASLTYPKNSIRQIPGVWDELKFVVMGRDMTLNDIEHATLRKKFEEPRVHMALVCASVGCPPLRDEAYAGPKLEKQLEDQARAFLAVSTKLRIDRQAKRVYLSPIFKWFGEDFVKAYAPDKGYEGRAPSERAVLNFIGRHLDETDARFLRDGEFAVKFLDYDWTLNERAPR